MALTLFTGIAELDEQIFSNIIDIVSLRNLYVTSKSSKNFMDNKLVINNIKNTLKRSYQIHLLPVFSFDEIMNEMLHIHYNRIMGRHAFCAFLLKQNRFDLIKKFFKRKKLLSPAEALRYSHNPILFDEHALAGAFELSGKHALPHLCKTYKGDYINNSFHETKIHYFYHKEKSYYGLIKYLAKNKLLSEMKTLVRHIDFTESMANRLCRELSVNSNYFKMKTFVEDAHGQKKGEGSLKADILEYLLYLFPSLLRDNKLYYCVAESCDITIHKILRNDLEWYRLYPIIKEKFRCCGAIQTAVLLLNAYPELYFDDKIIAHLVTINRTTSWNPISYEYLEHICSSIEGLYEVCGRLYKDCGHQYGNFLVGNILLLQGQLMNDILNYWHVHHPDKHFWYDKLSREITVGLGLYDKTSNVINFTINFMQKNPNCSPKDVFKICNSFIYKDKFTMSDQKQTQLSYKKYPQTNHAHKRQQTKCKRLHYNQPTSHKRQCRNYRK
jgi:hypothetical protein